MKIVILFFIASILFAQQDFTRWKKRTPDYQKRIFSVEEQSSATDNIFSLILGNAQKVYKVLISDVDGENCPFYPSCSKFYVQSVRQTNILKGTLMFFDRFTRDMNIFRNRNNYDEIANGKLFDPVTNYMLKPDKIKFKFKD